MRSPYPPSVDPMNALLAVLIAALITWLHLHLSTVPGWAAGIALVAAGVAVGDSHAGTAARRYIDQADEHADAAHLRAEYAAGVTLVHPVEIDKP